MSWSIRGDLPTLRGKRSVTLGTPIAEELPRLSGLRNHVEIDVGHQHRIFRAARLRKDLSARIAEVALAIELADVPRLLASHAVDRADKISIRPRMRRLLQFPQVLRKSGYRRRRIENNLGAIHSQDPRPFGKMAVVADIHPDARELRIEHGITHISRGEVKIFPESRMHLRNVMISVFSQVSAVGAA